MKNKWLKGLALLLTLVLFTSCDDVTSSSSSNVASDTITTLESSISELISETEISLDTTISVPVSFNLSEIPNYSDKPYVEVNNNIPYFTDDELTATSYEKYSDLDSLQRCGAAMACVGLDIMPTWRDWHGKANRLANIQI